MNVKIVVSSFLIAAALICGIFLSFLGIRQLNKTHKMTEGYEKTTGYFVTYDVNYGENGTSYQLYYRYDTSDGSYVASATSSTSVIPKQDSIRTVFYDPDDPENAVVAGSGSGPFLIVIGLLFLLVSLMILIAMLSSFGLFPNFLPHLLDLGIGITFMVIGFGVIYLIGGSFSIVRLFQTVPLYLIPLMAIPVFMVAAGGYLFVKNSWKKWKAFQKHLSDKNAS